MESRKTGNGSDIEAMFSSIEDIRKQIESARKIQKERVDAIERIKRYYGNGRYELLRSIIGDVDTQRAADLARAVCWHLSIELALSDARETEIAPILGGKTTEVIETELEKIMANVRRKFPNKD
jgi:hypothetical protein